MLEITSKKTLNIDCFFSFFNVLALFPPPCVLVRTMK